MVDRRNLWDRLPDLQREMGGIWDQIDRDMRARTAKPSSTGFVSWIELSYQPAGVWEEIDEETLLLRSEDLDLWRRAAQAAELAQSTNGNVWQEIDEETLLIRPPARDVWHTADDETLLLQPSTSSVWQEMRLGDLTRYRPQRKLGWALKPLIDTRGQR
jgi:hypothetical protein